MPASGTRDGRCEGTWRRSICHEGDLFRGSGRTNPRSNKLGNRLNTRKPQPATRGSATCTGFDGGDCPLHAPVICGPPNVLPITPHTGKKSRCLLGGKALASRQGIPTPALPATGAHRQLLRRHPPGSGGKRQCRHALIQIAAADLRVSLFHMLQALHRRPCAKPTAAPLVGPAR